MQSHRRIDMQDAIAGGTQPLAQLRLLARDQGRVETVDLGQGIAAHERIAATEFALTRRVHPVQVQYPVIQ